MIAFAVLTGLGNPAWCDDSALEVVGDGVLPARESKRYQVIVGKVRTMGYRLLEQDGKPMPWAKAQYFCRGHCLGLKDNNSDEETSGLEKSTLRPHSRSGQLDVEVRNLIAAPLRVEVYVQR